MRVLAVSHPAVLPVNQLVYARLAERGWDVSLVVPERWRHGFAAQAFAPRAHPALEGRLVPLPVALAGRQQRHFYTARVGRVLRRLRPDALVVEEELFSVAALQWGRAARRARIPYLVQAAENLDRPLPAAARAIRRFSYRHAAAVFARSPAAAERAARGGARGVVRVTPHAVPEWDAPARHANGRFTVGYAGRLVPEKGVRELVQAARLLDGDVRLLLAGDGPLRGEVESAAHNGLAVEVVTGLDHLAMPRAYAEMDVLVLPSRTTPRWSEQFGRVLVEALSCGVPVVGSDSGEIPWVIETTGGGRIVPEGDAPALAAALRDLRDDPASRVRLAEAGRAAVGRLFGVDAATDALESLLREVVGAKGAR